MRRWSGRGHRPSATNALAGVLRGRGVLRKRSRLLCQGGRSRLGNFRFARDLGMRSQSLTTFVRSAKMRWGYEMAVIVCVTFIFTDCQRRACIWEVREEFQSIAAGQILRISLRKFLQVSLSPSETLNTFVSSHSVGIVSVYSCNDIVNPYL